ncbi:MAG: hypothetical protein K2P12_05435, partial [Clostridia bacterium]|nr:hypothetical protein [Clostridia bacterium]
MKTNLVIVGENEVINKGVGEDLANILELNFLDFDGYCEYMTLKSRQEIISVFGKRKYNEVQKEYLPHMSDFCDSVIGFDGKLSSISAICKRTKDTSYIICIAERDKTYYKKYADIWINLGSKTRKRITNEIIKK